MKIEPYFDDIKEQLIVKLSAAKSSIVVAVAWLIDDDLIRTMADRAKEGVRVSVVISNHITNRVNSFRYSSLVNSGASLYVFEKKFLHHKFCVIDDSILITGSYNWSYGAIRNHENIVVIEKESNDADAWIKRFVLIQSGICKASVSQNIKGALSEFGVTRAIDRGVSELEIAEINLRREFEHDVRKSFEAAREVVTSLRDIEERMRRDGGGVRFVKRLIHEEVETNVMKSGFEKLQQANPPLVHLSFEYLVAKTKYQPLFSEEEIGFCRTLMMRHNINPG